MSAIDERSAAENVYSHANDLNRMIEAAQKMGLRVDITTEHLQVAESPMSTPHVLVRVFKPIRPGEGT